MTARQLFADSPARERLVAQAREAVHDDSAERRRRAALREHAEIRGAMSRIVAAAPVRRVVRATFAGIHRGYSLELECGHRVAYYRRKDTMHCHACAGQPSPTRDEEVTRG